MPPLLYSSGSRSPLPPLRFWDAPSSTVLPDLHIPGPDHQPHNEIPDYGPDLTTLLHVTLYPRRLWQTRSQSCSIGASSTARQRSCHSPSRRSGQGGTDGRPPPTAPPEAIDLEGATESAELVLDDADLQDIKRAVSVSARGA